MARGAWIAIPLVLAACSGDTGGAPAAKATPGLVGTWRTAEPVRFAGEGVRTETSGGRTTYRPDGRFDYRGRLTIFGERLPAEGLPFDMRGSGTWSTGNRILRERFTAVDIAPAAPNPTLARLGRDMAGEIVAREPTEADIVTLDATQMMLRDRATGTVATFARE